MKPQPTSGIVFTDELLKKSPYQIGQTMWVRETWQYAQAGINILYRANEAFGDLRHRIIGNKWSPSIFMPRWASRIDLEVIGIRVERLQEISEEDARAEGIQLIEHSKFTGQDIYAVKKGDYNTYAPNAYTSFMYLWDSINAKPKPQYHTINGKKQIVGYISYPWEDVREMREYRGKPWQVMGNPWVLVIKFKKIR